MKKSFLAILILIAFYSADAQEYKIDTLLYNGSIENRINYVILGDGYLESQLPIFLNDAQNLANELFTVTPYKEYNNYFNVFSISVPSNEAGAGNDPLNLIDNYFGSTFNFSGIDRLLVPTNITRITEVLVNNFPSYDQVFMLVNSFKYGGSGGSVATSSTNIQSTEIAIHELGHSFASLADEYWAGEQYAWETYNMTQETSTAKIIWKNWLGDENVGLIPHTGNASWKKPHNYCKMQFLGSPFCAVCREQFTRVFHKLISAIDDYSPKTLTSIDDIISFDVNLITPEPNTLKISWFLNDQRIASNENSVEINKTNLNEENNVLTINVYDSTTYDRRTTIYVNSVTWNISNTITSSISNREEYRQEEIITSVEVINKERLVLNVFPNPTLDKLKIEYVLTHPSHIQFSIINMNGQLIKKLSWQKGNSGNNQFEIDLLPFEQGIYFLKFESNSFEQTIRFIKEN
jgi:hypothetical protein